VDGFMSVVLDTLTVMLVGFGFSFLALSVYSGFMGAEPEFRDSLNDSSNLAVNESLASLDVVSEQFPSVFDGAILFIFIGLWAFALISAFFIDTHPVFFIFAVLLMVAVFVVAAIIGNVGGELLSEDVFSGVSGEFPITLWLLNHFFMVFLVVGFSVLLVMFGKGRGGQ
jgi:hypothetical protein